MFNKYPQQIKSQPSASFTRRRGSRGGRLSTQRPTQRDLVTHKEINGYRFEPGVSIPQIEQIPFNKLTLVSMHRGVTSVTTIKASELASAIKEQLDTSGKSFPSTPQIDMKISTIRVWNLTGKSLAVTIYDFSSNTDVTSTTATEEALVELIDNKSDSIPAIGYSLPLSLRNVILTNVVSKPRHILDVLGSAGSDIMIVINLKWKLNGPTKLLYTGISSIKQIENDLNTTVNNIRRIKKQLDSVINPETEGNSLHVTCRADSQIRSEIINSVLNPVPVVSELPLLGLEKPITDSNSILLNILSRLKALEMKDSLSEFSHLEGSLDESAAQNNI